MAGNRLALRLQGMTRHERVCLVGLVLVVAAGMSLRLSGADWDDGAHLHPDERYISIVANAVEWPASPLEYLNVAESPLSPYNTQDGRAYSYGVLPLFGTKAVADAVGLGDYDQLYLVGRVLAALADSVTIVLVFLVARLLFAGFGAGLARAGAVLAAALYAVTVAAMQASHFFTTDPWLVLLSTLAVYLALLLVSDGERSAARPFVLVSLGGLTLGLAVASKASGAFVLLPLLAALVGRAALDRAGAARGAVGRLVGDVLLLLVVAYLGFRLASPYSFATSNWLDLRLGTAYREALETQRDILDGRTIFPPTVQWLLSERIWSPLRNLVVWQLGPPLGICALAGLAVLLSESVHKAFRVVRSRRSGFDHDELHALVRRLVPLVYVLVSLTYVVTRFQHMGRYLLPILPLLAVAAAYALLVTARRAVNLAAVLAALVLTTTGLYAFAFHAVYDGRTTRLQATDWIAANVAPGAAVASEHWDDSLPVGGVAARYTLVEVPVFEPDDETKLRKLHAALSRADYYALSSPRAWRTIGRLPDRYPLMTRFYRSLFAERLGFDLAAAFSSRPRLFGVELDDLGAEEAFWVYDHPPVRIYRNSGRLSFAQFERVLCAAPAPPACG